MPLTDVQVRALESGARIRRLWDTQGLHLECRPTGSKLWIFRFRFGGQQKRLSFGLYPEVSLKEARDRRDAARRQLRDGLDPGAEKKRAKLAQRPGPGTSVEAICREWFAEHVPGWTPAYAQDAVRAFEKHIYPKLGTRPMADVQPAELLQILRGMTAEGTRRELVRRIRQKCEAIWNYAIVTRRAAVNIAAPLKGVLRAPTVVGFAAIPEPDLPAFLVALRAYGNVQVEWAVLLQLLTATRPGETRGARWDEVDFKRAVWTIPAARMKKRIEHVVPLSSQAVQVLKALRPVSGHYPVLFPSRSRTTVPMSENTVGGAFKRLGYGGVTAHGFRKLFSTAAHEAGQRSDVIEMCLAHVDANRVRGVYNHAQHLTARRELLQWWGDRVEGLCQAYTAAHNVLNIFAFAAAGSNVSGH